jgi:hypothetical protein
MDTESHHRYVAGIRGTVKFVTIIYRLEFLYTRSFLHICGVYIYGARCLPPIWPEDGLRSSTFTRSPRAGANGPRRQASSGRTALTQHGCHPGGPGAASDLRVPHRVQFWVHLAKQLNVSSRGGQPRTCAKGLC